MKHNYYEGVYDLLCILVAKHHGDCPTSAEWAFIKGTLKETIKLNIDESNLSNKESAKYTVEAFMKLMDDLARDNDNY